MNQIHCIHVYLSVVFRFRFGHGLLLLADILESLRIFTTISRSILTLLMCYRTSCLEEIFDALH